MKKTALFPHLHPHPYPSLSFTMFLTLAPPSPPPPQHYRYIGKSGDYRGTYIGSEAPLLLKNISLVDPTDRSDLMHCIFLIIIIIIIIITCIINYLCLLQLYSTTESQQRRSGGSQRTEKRSGCRSGRAGSSLNPSSRGRTASSHSSGKVREDGTSCLINNYSYLILFNQ